MANCAQCGRKLPALSFRKICQWCVQHEAAQRGEDDAVQRVMPTPWARGEASVTVTQVLFGANVAVFLAMVAATVVSTGQLSLDFSGPLCIHFGANFGPYTLSGQWWRLVTYMFLHGGFFHIAMNMWCLWNLGTLCESLYGRWTYLAVYFITGIAGGLASLMWNPNVPVVGASGALFGLSGALIASFALGEFSLSGISIKGTLTSLLFFAGFSLFFGSVVPGIDNSCHIGGLISGLALGALIARVAPDQGNSFRRVGVLGFVALIVLSSAVGIQRWRGYAPRFSRAVTERDIDQTIAELQKKLQRNPQDATAHYALAHAYLVKGGLSEGESELRRVIELQPQQASARMELGTLYLNSGQSKQAEEQFARLVEQDPGNTRAHIGFGMALAGVQNHEAAVREFKTALQQDPQAEGVYYSLGLSQAELKQYDEAIASYQRERATNGDDPALETALADAYQAKGMTQQADEARNKAAQLKGGQQD